MTRIAYHGSPHRFDRFSLDHVGSGEGAQMYGWGIYFTETQDIAEHYRKALSSPLNRALDGLAYILTKSAFGTGYDVGKGIRSEYTRGQSAPPTLSMGEEWEDFPTRQAAIDALLAAGLIAGNETLSELPSTYEGHRDLDSPDTAEEYSDVYVYHPGIVYEVKIPGDGEYLLWDKTLSDQPERIKVALSKISSDRLYNLGINGDFTDAYTGVPLTGENLIKYLGNSQSPKWASEFLSSLGIAGVQYLDGSRRYAKEGNYNFVLFDDKRIAIQSAREEIGLNMILVDGVKRPRTNSDGNLISNTSEGLLEFWRWFGDSKAVDAKGRPIVVHHGSGAEFETFELNDNPIAYGNLRGFYFAKEREVALEYGTKVKAVYLKTDSPFTGNPFRAYADSKGIPEPGWGDKPEVWQRYREVNPATVKDFLVQSGHDAVIRDRGFEEWMVFDNKQIMSVQAARDILANTLISNARSAIELVESSAKPQRRYTAP